MTASTMEQRKLQYAQQLAAHTLRQWNSAQLVKILTEKDVKAWPNGSSQKNNPKVPELRSSTKRMNGQNPGLEFTRGA